MAKKRSKLNMGWKNKSSADFDNDYVGRLMDSIAKAYKVGNREAFQQLKQEIESRGVQVTIKDDGRLSFTTPWEFEDGAGLMNSMFLDVIDRGKENDKPQIDVDNLEDEN